MKELSLFDRKFLAACRISAERPRHSDEEFLRACGIDTTLTPEEFRDANKHRDISTCRGCGARTFEQHTQNCRHRALEGTEEPRRYSDFTFLRACGVNPVFSLAEFRAANKHHAAEPCRDCGARTLQQHAKTCRHRVALDGTVQLMAKHGIPITRENYLMLAFGGTMPDEPLDEEIEAEIPREVLAAEKRRIRKADREFLRAVGIAR
jgi:ribosomal protein L37E